MNCIQILFDLCVRSHSGKVGIPIGLEYVTARQIHASVNGAFGLTGICNLGVTFWVCLNTHIGTPHPEVVRNPDLFHSAQNHRAHAMRAKITMQVRWGFDLELLVEVYHCSSGMVNAVS